MILTVDELKKQSLKSKTIAFPTDTVYGLGCLLGDEESVRRIFEIKGRDFSKPLAILAPSFESIQPLVKDLKGLKELSDKYWPGALTVVTQKTDLVSDLTTAGHDTVGIRIPNHPVALEILNHFGVMVVTSLNKSNEPAILKFEDVLNFQDRVDFIIDGGNLSNLASTVYDLNKGTVLRQGEVKVEV